MNAAETLLTGTASLFLALGDKTRLRLLNLIRDRETCVSSFTDVLGDSQPKISRHLAYLRNAGIVEVRRHGKWMHYSISTQIDENTRRLLLELFKWMEQQDELQADREKLDEMFGTSETSEQAARSPRIRSRRAVPSLKEREPARPVYRQTELREPDVEDYPVRHNELEDFLL